MEEIVKSIEGLLDQEPFHLDKNASKMEILKKLYEYYKLGMFFEGVFFYLRF